MSCMKKFDKNSSSLRNQFDDVSWIEESGLNDSQLREEVLKLTENMQNLSRAVVKARTFELILKKSRIAIDQDDIFQDKLFGRGIISSQRASWEKEVIEKVCTIFRELRTGETLDRSQRVKTTTSVLSTAEAISLLCGSMALAGSFGTGTITEKDLAAGLQGAIVKEDGKDFMVWKEYLEQVMKKRGSHWSKLYEACKELNV